MRTLRAMVSAGLAVVVLVTGLVLAPPALAVPRHVSRTQLELVDRRDRLVTLVAHVQVAGGGDRQRAALDGGSVQFSWRLQGRPGASWRRLGSDRLDRGADASIRVLVRESGPVVFRALFTGTRDVRRSADTVTERFDAGRVVAPAAGGPHRGAAPAHGG